MTAPVKKPAPDSENQEITTLFEPSRSPVGVDLGAFFFGKKSAEQ
jgi:hypothetical protein